MGRLQNITLPSRRLTAGIGWKKLILWAVGIYGVATLLALFLLPHFILPAEDALILFQFSRNLANTGAITFNAHGARAEGATDFAWMAMIAAGIKLHISPYVMTSLFNVVSLIALPFVLARIAGRPLRMWAALFVMGAFGLIPQATAALLGFSVLPFSLLLATMVLCFVKRNELGLALTCLALCLFRPDGVVFSVPLLVAAVATAEDRWRRLGVFLTWFVIPGSFYFAWRWHYFGAMLPLPFLVKADTERLAHVVVRSSLQEGLLLVVFTCSMVGFILDRSSKVSRATRLVVACMLIVPTLFYFSMRLDQDVGHRFFVYLPVGLAVVMALQWREISGQRGMILLSGAALWLVLISRMWWISVENSRAMQFDNRKGIADELSILPHGTLVSTEAGLLPYFSAWPTYDAWGLNTPRFSKRLIQPEDVSAIRPDVMLVHTSDVADCQARSGWRVPYKDRTWGNMTRNLVAGAGDAYDLWIAPFGSIKWRAEEGMQPWQGGQECWFVRRDSQLRSAVETILERHSALSLAEYQARTAKRIDDASLRAGETKSQPSVARRLVWDLIEELDSLSQST